MSEHYTTYLYRHTSQLIEFIFETEHNIQYYVTFRPAHYHFRIECVPCQSVFEVSFKPDSDISVSDRRIRNTIILLIEEFIHEHKSPVLYVCDNLDKKEFCRQRLFLRWFENSSIIDFRHESQLIEIENYNLVIGIIAFKWDAHFENYFDQVEHW